MSTRQERIEALEKQWAENPRWAGIERTYSAEEVVKLIIYASTIIRCRL